MGLRPMAVSVKPLHDYKLLVTFDNEEQRIFDVAPYMRGGWFEELRNPAAFNTVHVAGLSIEWDTGHDICPDDLYYNSIPFNNQDTTS